MFCLVQGGRGRDILSRVEGTVWVQGVGHLIVEGEGLDYARGKKLEEGCRIARG
jgi:hypothetical protein